MAAKVALTAEEFRENSQRSIALFNTEKLSTDSTHVLKSAYCNSVHFCRCNLHGACGGKVIFPLRDERFFRVAICTGRVEAKVFADAHGSVAGCCNLHGACGGKAYEADSDGDGDDVAICTGRVEAKSFSAGDTEAVRVVAICTGRVEAKVHFNFIRTIDKPLQSARSVWRQR